MPMTIVRCGLFLRSTKVVLLLLLLLLALARENNSFISLKYFENVYFISLMAILDYKFQ